MSSIKIAGAPISWGVCEVPGWGHQMEADRVLSEMKSIGFSATEFGPPGFLPEDAAGRLRVLSAHGLTAVGGFVGIKLHDKKHDPLPEAERELAAFQGAGAEVFVIAATSGSDDYNSRTELSDEEWATLITNLERIVARAKDFDIRAVLHPHVGTVVERESDIARILNGSDVKFCFDTGHMMIGGTDPVAFAKAHADRVGHVHFKDVHKAVAQKVIDDELSYYDAVVASMYAPLGQGDVDVATIISSLQSAGYDGWYVLEQDNVITNEPAEGAGPISDANASATFLRDTVAAL